MSDKVTGFTYYEDCDGDFWLLPVNDDTYYYYYQESSFAPKDFERECSSSSISLGSYLRPVPSPRHPPRVSKESAERRWNLQEISEKKFLDETRCGESFSKSLQKYLDEESDNMPEISGTFTFTDDNVREIFSRAESLGLFKAEQTDEVMEEPAVGKVVQVTLSDGRASHRYVRIDRTDNNPNVHWLRLWDTSELHYTWDEVKSTGTVKIASWTS